MNRGLQKKWLHEKTDAQNQQLEKENEMRKRDSLMEGPSERVKNRKGRKRTKK